MYVASVFVIRLKTYFRMEVKRGIVLINYKTIFAYHYITCNENTAKKKRNSCEKVLAHLMCASPSKIGHGPFIDSFVEKRIIAISSLPFSLVGTLGAP